MRQERIRRGAKRCPERRGEPERAEREYEAHDRPRQRYPGEAHHGLTGQLQDEEPGETGQGCVHDLDFGRGRAFDVHQVEPLPG